jgi:hypothetical protein
VPKSAESGSNIIISCACLLLKVIDDVAFAASFYCYRRRCSVILDSDIKLEKEREKGGK